MNITRHNTVLFFLTFVAISVAFTARGGNTTEHDSLPAITMKATYYADKFHGRKTSSGEIFDQGKLSAAHKTIKFGTWVRVTNLKNGKQVTVKINDRCPRRGVIDLSKAAATSIGMKGTSKVSVQILSEPDENSTSLSAILSYAYSAKLQETTGDNTQNVAPQKEEKTIKKETKKKRVQKNKKVCSIELCTASSLREAHKIIDGLSTPYNEYATAVAQNSSGTYSIQLKMDETFKGAEATIKRLRADYPNCKILSCD